MPRGNVTQRKRRYYTSVSSNGRKMRYQILPFLVCVPFAVANEYSALSDASTARDFYFISIRYAVQYSPICFDESLTFIRCAHYNIKTT